MKRIEIEEYRLATDPLAGHRRGKPTARMTGNAGAWAAQLGVTEVLVTITHTDTSALVMAVAVGEHEA
jgi:phosphopantetheinyl transferase (holo-ACP synthase)